VDVSAFNWSHSQRGMADVVYKIQYMAIISVGVKEKHLLRMFRHSIGAILNAEWRTLMKIALGHEPMAENNKLNKENRNQLYSIL